MVDVAEGGGKGMEKLAKLAASSDGGELNPGLRAEMARVVEELGNPRDPRFIPGMNLSGPIMDNAHSNSGDE